jgi:type IV pilus assembly protein PilQ
LIAKLDIPVRQVLIESRIVNADETFAKDLGVRFGTSKTINPADGDYLRTIGGGNTGITEFNPNTSFHQDGVENLIVDLPAAVTGAGALSLAVGKLGSWLVQLELSALIAEGRGENIASPKVITTNQREAIIESGVEIPYTEASSSGATTVSFKKVVLSLKVTPQITPDNKILLDLQVNQDTQGAAVAGGIPTINTKSVGTQVMVDNGETVVLGGIYGTENNTTTDRIPFFGDLPYLGFLFKRTSTSTSKQELLIFVTPKILGENLNI